MASIADVWISVLPDTSKIAPKIKEALRTTERELKAINVDVKADTAAAKTEIERLDGQTVKVKVDVDRSALDRAFSGFGGGGGGGFGSGGGGIGGALKLNLGLVGVGLLPAAATALTDVAGAIQQLAGAGAVLPGVFAGIASSVGVAKLSMQGMSDAFEAVNKAADGTQASVDAANKALAELSPNAASTVKTVVGLKSTFTELRNIGSQNMFAGVGEGLKGLVTNLLPSVTRGVNGISKSLNQNLLQAMNSLGSGSSKGFLDRIFGNTGNAQGRLSAAIDPIVNGVLRLAAAGSDSLPRLADAVGKVAERFNKFITAADGDGRLKKWISDGLDGFTDLGNIVLNLGKSFTGITEAAGGGAGLLSTLESATAKMATFLNSAQGQDRLRTFFQQGRDMLGQLRDVAAQVGPVLGGIFNSGLRAANLWLPVIRKILETINSIPGGAAAVVGAFVAWKTISGVASLASSLTNIANLLRVTLPASAAASAGAMSTSLAGVVSTLAGITASVAALPAVAGGFALWGDSQLRGAPDSPENAAARGRAGIVGRSNLQDPNRYGTLPSAPAGGLPGAQALRRGGYRPGAPAGGAPGAQVDRRGGYAPPLPIPAVGTYMPPVVTEVPSGGGGGAATPNLPYAGTADPYAMQSGLYGGGYQGDDALLSAVPAGRYDSGAKNLALGLADCSSAVEDLVALMDGRSTSGGSLTTMNAASMLPGMGFVQGMGGPGDFRIGYNSGHMQATLPGGTNFNWGSDSAAAKGGRTGLGADDPALTTHWYRPVSGGAAGSMYPGMDGGPGGLTSQDLTLRNAQQRVNDTLHSQEQAEGRLNELRAKGTATDRQMEAAEYAVAKAKREHQDAIDGLTVATDKYNKSQAKGQGGNGDMSSLGGDLFGGVLEAIGLDGSLFKNPFESGMWKGVTGVANFAGALGQAQNGSMIPGGSGGGLGGLLGMAQNFLPGITGMPGMPGANSQNIVDAAQFKAPGAAGPGNTTIDQSMVFNGAPTPQESSTMYGQWASQNRYPALQQHLPGQG